MLLQRGDEFDQPLIETRDARRWPLLHLSEIEGDANDWPVAIRARAAENTSFEHLHGELQ
jgi:hypothetical protein